MKISEIVSKLLGLEKSVSELSAAGANASISAITSLAGELATVKAGAVAGLTQSEADLATAKQTITTLTANLEKANSDATALSGNIKSACTSLKLEVKAGATNCEMLTALQDSVSTTLAKLNVDPKAIPAPGAAAPQPAKPELKGRARFAAAIKIQTA